MPLGTMRINEVDPGTVFNVLKRMRSSDIDYDAVLLMSVSELRSLLGSSKGRVALFDYYAFSVAPVSRFPYHLVA